MDTRKWGIVIIGLVFALTILGYFYTPYDPNEGLLWNDLPSRSKPSLGTDHFGRDVE